MVVKRFGFIIGIYIFIKYIFFGFIFENNLDCLLKKINNM